MNWIYIIQRSERGKGDKDRVRVGEALNRDCEKDAGVWKSNPGKDCQIVEFFLEDFGNRVKLFVDYDRINRSFPNGLSPKLALNT